MIISLILVLILIIFSAMFAAAETSLLSASKAYMQHKEKEEKSFKAALYNKLFKSPDSLIGAILISNNVINIFATSLSTGIFIEVFGDKGIAYATFIMTIALIIFAEILPKTYAINNSNKCALNLVPIMYIVAFIFSPIVKITQKIVNLILYIMGLSGKQELNSSFVHELRGAIDMAEADKVIPQEKHMLKSVLDLSEVTVYDVMIHRKDVFSINVDSSIDEIIEKALASPFSRIPIYKDKPENIIGILRARILMQAIRKFKSSLEELDIMSIISPPWFILETTTLLHQLQEFRNKREHFAVVIDEYGSLEGIITLEDVLEEIVGDINDESDISKEDSGIKSQTDGSFIVEGKVTIRDLNRKLNWDIPDEEAATIAGLLLNATERIPKENQQFNFYGYEFLVLSKNRNSLNLIKIRKIKD